MKWSYIPQILAVIAVMGAIIFPIVYVEKKAAEDAKPYNDARFEMWKRSENAAIDNCIKRGMSPIRSSWDGRIVDCR